MSSFGVVSHPRVLTDVPMLDTVIAAHAQELGEDLAGYRNHSYRVLNLCLALGPTEVEVERIATAAAYHDLGIWTHRTFDYLEPSAGLAAAHLQAEGKVGWIPRARRALMDGWARLLLASELNRQRPVGSRVNVVTDISEYGPMVFSTET